MLYSILEQKYGGEAGQVEKIKRDAEAFRHQKVCRTLRYTLSGSQECGLLSVWMVCGNSTLTDLVPSFYLFLSSMSKMYCTPTDLKKKFWDKT